MANLSRLFRSNKVFLIIFALIVLARTTVSAILSYYYIHFSSIKEVKKGGTFVEGIYEPISYLPYRGDYEKNHFYQTLLFPGCEGGIDGSVCDIMTTDDKVYAIKIKPGLQWSDNSPFILDDVIFSYQDIVISNLWTQPYLAQYQDIFMSEGETGSDTLLVTFPTANTKNRNFFKLPIIPYHSMKEFNLEEYVQKFAMKPITLSCVKLKTSSDDDSLIFDLSTCKNSFINYYQIKSFDNIQHLQDHIGSIKNILSFYYGNSDGKGYNLLPLQDNYFVTMFFNTKSTKLSPRIQRAIGGFVNYNLWKDTHTGYINKYEGLLSAYQTTGSQLGDFIKEKNPYLTYDKALLAQGGVKPLPSTFTIDRAKRKSAFYLNPTTDTEYTIIIETTDPVFNLKAKSDKSIRYLTTRAENNNKRHIITATIGANQQIVEGLNSITIGGTVLGKKQEVASIDIYYLGRTSTADTINTIKIITLDNKISNYLRAQLQKSFTQYNLQDLFEFVVYSDKDSFLKAITDKRYDMALSTIKMESLADVHTILNSQDPQINPSLYFNPTLNQFVAENKRSDVRSIFSTELPFFIVGQMMKPYRLRDDISLNYTGTYDENTIKEIMIKNVSIVSRNQIKGRDLIKPSNIINFIKQQRK